MIPFYNYSSARNLEKLLHKEFKEYQVKHMKKFPGYTEFFLFECFTKVLLFLYNSEFRTSVRVIESERFLKTKQLFSS